jgi:hypothetical protein
MQQAVVTRAPAHLWIVGVLATLWNAFGCYDYLMTRMRDTDYLASAMPGVDPAAVLAWVDAFPIYAQVGWGLGVWGGLAGSILLLFRSRLAVHAFAVSMLGIILSIGYQLVSAPPPDTQRGMSALVPYLVIVVGLALLYYAWTQRSKGVLR